MDVWWRVIVVAGVVLLALGVGRLAVRQGRPSHPPVRLDGLGLGPGVVVFTSTECDNCKQVMAMVSSVEAPVREVTQELEPGVIAAAAVEAVPLVAVTDRRGRLVRQLAGVPSRRALQRALTRAGW